MHLRPRTGGVCSSSTRSTNGWWLARRTSKTSPKGRDEFGNRIMTTVRPAYSRTTRLTLPGRPSSSRTVSLTSGTGAHLSLRSDGSFLCPSTTSSPRKTQPCLTSSRKSTQRSCGGSTRYTSSTRASSSRTNRSRRASNVATSSSARTATSSVSSGKTAWSTTLTAASSGVTSTRCTSSTARRTDASRLRTKGVMASVTSSTNDSSREATVRSASTVRSSSAA